jgi:hypothetical protein
VFFGYHLSATLMVRDENRQSVPNLARRMTVCNSAHDPAVAPIPVLAGMAAGGASIGDMIADSGYSHRVPSAWAVPVRSLSPTCNPATADPAAPTRAPSSATEIGTARPPRNRYCS